MTDMINNKTNVSWSNYIRETIEGCDFSHPINTKFNRYHNINN